MASARYTPEGPAHPQAAGPGLARPRYTPRRHHTPAGLVTIELLRRLHPATLQLPDDWALAYEDWRQHGRQASEFVLVAALPVGGRRRVLGKLELSVREHDPATGQPARGVIDRVFVRPEHRRLGLGARLVGAAIGFARENGFAALREYIPNLLAPAGGAAGAPVRWAVYEPAEHEWGGVASLGATAQACALERQPCAVVRVSRGRPLLGAAAGEGRPPERIGVVLELPLGGGLPAGDAATGDAGGALLDRLLAEIVARAPLA